MLRSIYPGDSDRDTLSAKMNAHVIAKGELMDCISRPVSRRHINYDAA
jgi:hypothetical protein